MTADGAVPTGRVILEKGPLRLGRGDLDSDGVATIRVLRIFRVGTHTLTAKYRRDEGFRPSATDFTVRVRPRRPPG